MNPTQKLIIRELLKQGCATQKQLTAATRAAPTTIRALPSMWRLENIANLQKIARQHD